jgi:hypothetical protein
VKTKLVPWVGLDFEESKNIRLTCFQLCEAGPEYSPADPLPRGLVAVACVDLNQHGELERFYSSPRYRHRETAIIRLARRHQKLKPPHTL